MSEIERYENRPISQELVEFHGPEQAEGGGDFAGNFIVPVLRRWRVVLLTFLLGCGIGVPAAWFLSKSSYTVVGAIRVAPILTKILSGEKDTGEISNYRSFMNTQAEMITSGNVVERVADNLAAKNLAFFQPKKTGLPSRIINELTGSAAASAPEPVKVLKQAISGGVIGATAGRNDELIRIVVQSGDPVEARQIVDAFIDAYMAVEVSSSTQDEDNKLGVLESERRSLAEKMQRQRESIFQMGQEFGSTSLGSRHDMKLKRIASLLSELTKLEAQRIHLEARVKLLENASKGQTIGPEEMLQMRSKYVSGDPTVNVLIANITQLEQQLIVAKQRLAPTNPELKLKAELIEILKERLSQHQDEAGKNFDSLMSEKIEKAGKRELLNSRAELEQTQAYEQRFKEMLEKEDVDTIGLGRKQLTIDDMQDQLALTKETYDTIRRRIQELDMERKRPARISVAYYADVVGVENKRPKLLAAAMFGSAALAVVLALIKDKLDRSLWTPGDVTKCIGVRIIGTTTSSEGVSETLLPQHLTDDYQAICANLGLLNGEAMPARLVVSSASPREGKTTLSINLATSIAGMGRSVLLIDGDLRKPDIATLLKLSTIQSTLQDVLRGCSLDQAVCAIGVTGLSVLPAGTSHPSKVHGLIASRFTSKMLDEAGQKYDHVIIDSPPVLSVPDGLVWAKMAGAVILTSFAGQTEAPDLKEAMERIEQLGVKIMGVVLNSVPVRHSYNRYGYGYGSNKDHRRSHRPQVILLPGSGKDDRPADPPQV